MTAPRIIDAFAFAIGVLGWLVAYAGVSLVLVGWL